MNEQQLQRSLQSIGMACFVKYYQDFSNQAISPDSLIEKLMAREDWEETGCKTRIYQSRKIIKEGSSKDALIMIEQSKSKKIPDDIKRQPVFLRQNL